MKRLNITGWMTANRDFLKRACVISLLFLFAAHAFCFFNLTYSGESVMLSAAKGANAQTAAGQYLQPFYWRLRGSISSPMLVGLLSALYLTLCAVLTAALLGIRRTGALFALCGALIVNPAVLSVCAASLHTADAAFLSMLLAVAAVALCRAHPLGFLPGACLFAASPALDPAGPAVGVSLALLGLIRDIMDEQSTRTLIIRAVKTICALAAGAALYAGGYLVLLRAYGLDAQAALQTGDSLLSLWLAPIRSLLAPLTAYPRANVLLRALLALLTVIALCSRLRGLSRARGTALIICCALLPLCTSLPRFAAEPVGQTSLSYALLDVLPVLLLLGSGELPRVMRRAALSCFAVLLLGGVVFSNQVYLKKNLEYEATLSVMTRVLDRVEQTEGYRSGYTPVAIVGSLEDSVLSAAHQGFEHLSVLDAAKNNYAARSYEENIWYMWGILGYPCNLVGIYEQAVLAEDEAVKAMPAFPQEGCCAFVGDTLVIKLSQTAP